MPSIAWCFYQSPPLKDSTTLDSTRLQTSRNQSLPTGFNFERQSGSKVQVDSVIVMPHCRWVDRWSNTGWSAMPGVLDPSKWTIDDAWCRSGLLQFLSLITHFCLRNLWIWVSGYRKQEFTDSKSGRIFIVKEVFGVHIILPVNNDERKFIF